MVIKIFNIIIIAQYVWRLNFCRILFLTEDKIRQNYVDWTFVGFYFWQKINLTELNFCRILFLAEDKSGRINQWGSLPTFILLERLPMLDCASFAYMLHRSLRFSNLRSWHHFAFGTLLFYTIFFRHENGISNAKGICISRNSVWVSRYHPVALYGRTGNSKLVFYANILLIDIFQGFFCVGALQT